LSQSPLHFWPTERAFKLLSLYCPAWLFVPAVKALFLNGLMVLSEVFAAYFNQSAVNSINSESLHKKPAAQTEQLALYFNVMQDQTPAAYPPGC
jgi:hypothetical protein